MKNILIMAFIVFAGWKFYNDTYVVTDGIVQQHTLSTKQRTTMSPVKVVQRQQFECDGRQHCSQMNSCSEATYFIQHCPDTKMDGDHDGVPCERQWC